MLVMFLIQAIISLKSDVDLLISFISYGSFVPDPFDMGVRMEGGNYLGYQITIDPDPDLAPTVMIAGMKVEDVVHLNMLLNLLVFFLIHLIHQLIPSSPSSNIKLNPLFQPHSLNNMMQISH